MSRQSTNNEAFQEFLTQTRCCVGEKGAEYQDGAESGSPELEELACKLKKTNRLLKSIEDYIPIGTVLSTGVSAEGVVDFTGFNTTVLGNGMEMIIQINATIDNTPTDIIIAQYTADYQGISLTNLLIDIASEINGGSAGFTAVATTTTLTLTAPVSLGDIPNGTTIEFNYADYYALSPSVSVDTGNDALGYPTKDSFGKFYFPNQSTTDQGKLMKFTAPSTVAALTSCAGTIDQSPANWSTYISKNPYSVYSSPVPINATQATFRVCQQAVVDDAGEYNDGYVYYFVTVSGLYYLRTLNAAGTFISDQLFATYYTNLVWNPTSHLLYLFDNIGGGWAVIDTLTDNTHSVVDSGSGVGASYYATAKYNPFNGCVYYVATYWITKIDSAGAFVNTLVPVNPSFIHTEAIHINPYTGELYLTSVRLGSTVMLVINAGAGGAACTQGTTISLPFVNYGYMGVKNGVDASTLRFYSCEESSNTVYEYDSTFAAPTDTFTIQQPYARTSISFVGCYYDNVHDKLLITSNDTVGTTDDSVIVYDLVTTQTTQVLLPAGGCTYYIFTRSILQNETSGVLYYLEGDSLEIHSFDFATITDVVGQIWVNSGRYIRIYDVAADGTTSCSPMMYDMGEQGGGSPTILSYGVFKEDTREMILFCNGVANLNGAWIISVDNFGLGYGAWNPTNWDAYLYPLNNDPTNNIGLSDPYYGVYIPSTNHTVLIGTYNPVGSRGFCYIPSDFSTIGNVLIAGSNAAVSAAYDSTTNTIVILLEDGTIQLYTTGYALIASYATGETFVAEDVFCYYDPYYTILVISNTAGGNILIVDLTTGTVITTIDISAIATTDPFTIIGDDAGKIYISTFDGSQMSLYPLSLTDGGSFTVSGGEFSGGVTEVLQTENCLTAIQVEKIIGKIKQLCDCGCAGNITTDAPTAYDAFAVLAGIVTLSGSFILTLSGDTILPI